MVKNDLLRDQIRVKVSWFEPITLTTNIGSLDLNPASLSSTRLGNLSDMYRYYCCTDFAIHVYQPAGSFTIAGFNLGTTGTAPVDSTDFEYNHQIYVQPNSTKPRILRLRAPDLQVQTSKWLTTENEGGVTTYKNGIFYFYTSGSSSGFTVMCTATFEFRAALDPDVTMARRAKRAPQSVVNTPTPVSVANTPSKQRSNLDLCQLVSMIREFEKIIPEQTPKEC